MARYFIQRPIFSWVIAIVVMLAGLLAVQTLPVSQYPDIAPPSIQITGMYPGASAKTVEDSVTQVIEQKMKGIDGLRNMTSNSDATGGISITLNFRSGTDADIAQVQVQNKLALATPLLPAEVTQQGLVVSKATNSFLLILGFVSENGSMNNADLDDYIASSVVEPLSRIEGVGEVQHFGTQYAMRIWLDPAKLQKYSLMPSDVTSALTSQNTEVSAGQLGALPAASGQRLTATITARSKLRTAAQFREVIVKSDSSGAIVRLGDVARIELGSESYTIASRFDGKPSAAMGVKLATGANALTVSNAVKAKLAELGPFFPNQMKAVVGYDTTPFVRISIEEVAKTLVEAMVLVVLIMYLFLQNLRATLVPAIAVPVVLLGTFGVLALMGYSINTLTMFGMVLAIGLLVDDAIVVVENVERLMTEEGLSPKEATRKSMREITGALVGIALVLSAVFIPMAFFGGSTGVIYRQFSVTIVASMLLSVLVALTLSPALCATLLKPVEAGHHQEKRGFFGWFNRNFERNADRYRSGVGGLLHRGKRSLLVYALLVAVLGVVFMRLPTSFLPDEDQGTLMAQVKLPASATDEQLQQTMKSFEAYLGSQKEVAHFITLTGLSGDQATGNAFITLKDWSERGGKAQDAASLARRFTVDMAARTSNANVFVMLPPAVRGLGSNAGFDVQLQDLGGIGHEALVQAREQFLSLARKSPALSQVRSNNLDDTPQFAIDIDDRKAAALSLSTSDINDTLSSAMGGSYVNDFINNGRVKKVYVQADAPFRMQPDSIDSWYVRNGNSEMVPFSAFASSRWTYGSPQLSRYNGMSSFELIGDPAAGVSSGTAMNAVEGIMKQLPQGIGYEWAGSSYQERLSGSQAPLLYAVSILFVFLCLAALYESWSVPFSVMLVVPLGVLGAVLATRLAGLSNDVYFQVGLLTTVGLAAKNAILIVEFAKQLQDEGMALVEATLQAVRLRLRPILMTSLAFMFGVLPLALSTGAGSGSRRAIGVGVLGGVATATALGIFFVPLFFVVIRRFFAPKKKPGAALTLTAQPEA